jgi:sterol desaturase/sphingolipid hydroxylase (fatty acid hydroxylase superfamily)
MNFFQTDAFIRLSFFTGALLSLVLWEVFFPHHVSQPQKMKRWLSNIFLTVFNTVLVRFGMPISLLFISNYTNEKGYSILSHIQIAGIYKVILSVVLLDFFVYIQHLVFHKISFLWSLHSVHHSDIDLDVTSALRFHPLEIIISYLYKAFLIFLFGFSPESVIVFEIILNGMAMFNHSNIAIHNSLDKFLSYLIVTPSIHRVHHSVIPRETHSNFGFNIVLWDRIFRTFIQKKPEEIQAIVYGYENSPREVLGLWEMLVLPIKKYLE